MYTTEGIVLKKQNSGETDAIFTIYTKDLGKIRALAQGVKKERAKLKGHLEVLNLTDLSFVSGKNNFRLTSAITRQHFPAIRSHTNLLSLAYYFLALYDALILVEDKDGALWELLYKTLVFLESQELVDELSAPQIMSSFEHSFLVSMGYGHSGGGPSHPLEYYFGACPSRPRFDWGLKVV